MTRESRYQAYMGIMIGLLVGLLLLLGGCATSYQVRVCHQDINVCSEVKVLSYRKFEQPVIHYSRTDETVTFTYAASSATTADSPIEQAVADVIRTTPSVILPHIPN